MCRESESIEAIYWRGKTWENKSVCVWERERGERTSGVYVCVCTVRTTGHKFQHSRPLLVRPDTDAINPRVRSLLFLLLLLLLFSTYSCSLSLFLFYTSFSYSLKGFLTIFFSLLLRRSVCCNRRIYPAIQLHIGEEIEVEVEQEEGERTDGMDNKKNLFSPF